jgi:N-6 DNA Methylase/TaqI-like C-terminal specificity domain
MSRSLLKVVKTWQQAIAKDLTARYPDRSSAQQHHTTQAVIISILTFYLCEQQAILPSGCLQSLLEERDLSDRLYQLWQKLPGLGIAWQQDLAIAPVSDRCLRQVLHSLFLGKASLSLSIASLGQVYESLLSSGDQTGKPRKARGAYYTPAAIVDYILQNTLIQRLNQTSNDSLRLIDPACGGGIFLLSAYQRLLGWYLQKYLKHSQLSTQPICKAENGNWHLTLAERSRILRAHIYGIDLDSGAIAITQLSLELQCLAGELDRATLQIHDLSQNLQCDNTILRKDSPNEFDIVVGNPPYLDSEWMTMHLADWRSYCTAHYQTAIGNWDLFCIFIEKSLTLCKPNGWVSLVVPNKLAAADYAAAARSLLTRQTTLFALRDYAKTAAFSASVYPLVYVAQKIALPDATHQTVWYEQMQSLDQVEVAYELQIPCTLATAKSAWGIAQTPQQSALIDRLSQFPKLVAIAQITGAATVAEAYAIQPLIQDSAIQDSEAAGLKLVNSGTVDRYRLLWGAKPTRYLGQSYAHPIIPTAAIAQLPPKRYQQATQAKIIVAGLTRSLEAGLDAAGTVLAGKSTTLIRTIDAAIDLRYLLGLLNSRLIQLYFSSCFAGNQLQGGYFRVGSPQLRQLPVPNLSLDELRRHAAYDPLIDRVDRQLARIQSDQQIDQAIDRDIDQLVCRLYGLTDTEIEVVQRF